MKKIGIITFHASLNCGSMLQTYALQEVLRRKYNADVEIINYSNKGQRQYYAFLDMKLRPRVQKANLKAIPYWGEMKSVRNDYQSFAKDNFVLSGDLLKKYSQLEGIDEKYDIVIAGGDQVWNIKCRDADDAYFLSFVKNAKKVSYSPSMGAMNVMKYAAEPEKYANYIKDFNYLSIREPNGQKWVKELTGLDIPIVADPTMLLTVDEWTNYLQIEEVKEKFIFYYAFSYEKDSNNQIIQQISEKTGLPVYVIDAKSWGVNRLDRFGIKLYHKSGPLAFLELMKNAQLVITQSFHGTVFASLFHRNFWSIRNRVVVNKEDDRATSIMNQVGLLDRYQVIDDLVNIDLFQEIDYESVDRNIERLRKDAYSYIDKFMND